MSEEKTRSKKWPQRHQKSVEKWEKIGQKIDQEIPFDQWRGWYDLPVIVSCGYCDEWGLCDESRSCLNCFLFKKQVCSFHRRSYITFWQFIDEMVSVFSWRRDRLLKTAEEINWEKAKKLQQKILEAILEDAPKA